MGRPVVAGVDTRQAGQDGQDGRDAGTPEAALRASHLTALDVAFAAYYLLLIICHLIASRQRMGWTSAALSDLLACGYLLGLASRPRWRPLIVRLMALGLVAGIAELATDAAGEGVAHSLIYPGREPDARGLAILHAAVLDGRSGVACLSRLASRYPGVTSPRSGSGS